MKYKLSQKQLDSVIEDLKTWEFGEHSFNTYNIYEGDYAMCFSKDEFEPIAEPLPKPVIRNVEDLKALEGWELKHRASQGFHPLEDWDFDADFISKPKFDESFIVRQKDLPSNSFLLSECIEPEIDLQVGDLIQIDGMNKRWVNQGKYTTIRSRWTSDNDEVCYDVELCPEEVFTSDEMKLIRKAKDITKNDRIKYLGEEPENSRDVLCHTCTEEGVKSEILKGFTDFQIEQISQIIDDKLKERGE